MEKLTKWMILATISTGAFMASLDGSIVNITLPTLVKIFNVEFAAAKWVVLIYFLIVTTAILPFGRLGDVVGKKKIYLVGFIIFTIGSILCGAASSLLYLIIARAIQGLGGAMLMSLGFAIITQTFTPKDRGKALGIVATSVSAAIIIGPLVGGFILEHFSWRYIFYINIPVGILGVYMIVKFIEPDQQKKTKMFDIKSAILLFVLMLSLLTGIANAGKSGFDMLTIFLLAVFVVSLISFILFELKLLNPIMDFQLFKNQTFSIGLISGVGVFICLAGVLVLLPFYLESILGFKPGKTGLLISIIPLFMGISSPVAGMLSDRFGTVHNTMIGLVMLLMGFTAASGLSSDTSVGEFLLRMVLIGSGIGFFMTPNNTAIMGTVPKESLGVASGMLALSRTLGQALGVAVLGSLWTRKTDVLLAGVTDDTVAAKMMALQSTFNFVIIIMVIILLLNIYGMLKPVKSIAVKPLN